MSTIGLLALAIAAIFGLLVILVFPNVRSTIAQILMGSFLLMLGLTLVTLLLIAILNIDVQPFLRNLGVWLTGNRVVDFYAIFPEYDEVKKEVVQEVVYEDTDGDDQKEWLVFYQFDLTDPTDPAGGRSPYGGAVYDYDRGYPPVVFPYRLLPPDRDYLSEGVVRLDLIDIVEVGEAQSVKELLVYGSIPSPEEAGGRTDTDLNIFRHIPNSFEWEFPRDEPRRYQVIGAFRGDGGVTFDEATKNVTVISREDYDRSELTVQHIYALDKNRGTYMSVNDPQVLSPPISSEVTFAYGMPPDILDTPYPEKLVVGFYEMLVAKDQTVPPRNFLTGQALIEFDNNNLEYFGFSDVSGNWNDVKEVTITRLGYAPDTGQINPAVTYLGAEPRLQAASVAFEAKVGRTDTSTSTPIVWVTTVVNGKWKIDHRF